MPAHVIVLVGSKGGVGRTLVAANLASALARESAGTTLVIDADPKSSNSLSLMSGLKTSRAIHELSNIPGTLDGKQLGIMLPPQNGVSALGVRPDQKVNWENLAKHVPVLQASYTYIVVDGGAELNQWSGFWLNYASLALVVTAPEMLALQYSLKIRDQLQTSMFPAALVGLTINRVAPFNVIKPESIQKKLERQIVGLLPLDPESAENAASKSQLVLMGSPNGGLTKALAAMAKQIHTQIPLAQLQRTPRPQGLYADVGVSGGGGAGGGQAGSMSGGLRVVGKSSQENPDLWIQLKLKILKSLLEETDITNDVKDLGRMDAEKRNKLEEKARRLVAELLQKEPLSNTVLKSPEDRMQISREIFSEALYYGPLDDLLADERVKEIMVNGPFTIFVEREGKLQASKTTFSSEAQVRQVIDRIVLPLNRQINDKMPYVDARLPDGSRVHAIIPPIALNGSTITIRKFPTKRITKDDLIKFGSMTSQMADFLRLCVENHSNIVVSGGTGSGKTTLLNVLSSFIPANERILTVEDAAELQLVQPHVVRLETRPKGVDGNNEVSIRDLVKQSLRMRPDRIVVGECRAGEALDMLQAMNTGHDGSLTTVHSNNPKEAISRLETLCMMAGMDLPVDALRKQIGSAIHFIVQQARLSDGTRRVTHITEVCGMQGEYVALNDIFIFKEEGFDKQRKIIGRYVATGTIPRIVERLDKKGVAVDRAIFKNAA